MMHTLTMMEIMTLAKDFLVERYQNHRNQCLMTWQITNDHAWYTDGMIISCPNMPEYPNYEEVLELAGKIYMWTMEHGGTDEQEPMTETRPQATVVMYEPEPAPEPMPEPTVTGNVASTDTGSSVGNVYMEA